MTRDSRSTLNNRIKAATRALVDKAGGQTYAADQTRVPQSKLSEYGSVHKPDRFMPADVVADLEAAVGEPVVTRELAEQQGYVLVRASAAASPMSMLARVAAIGRSHGTLIEVLSHALDDGKIEAHEADAIRAALRPLQVALAELSNAIGGPGA